MMLLPNPGEARLAREAEIAFATVAMSTDYDCWREGHDAVTVEDVVRTAKANVSTAKQIVANNWAGVSCAGLRPGMRGGGGQRGACSPGRGAVSVRALQSEHIFATVKTVKSRREAEPKSGTRLRVRALQDKT